MASVPLGYFSILTPCDLVLYRLFDCGCIRTIQRSLRLTRRIGRNRRRRIADGFLYLPNGFYIWEFRDCSSHECLDGPVFVIPAMGLFLGIQAIERSVTC